MKIFSRKKQKTPTDLKPPTRRKRLDEWRGRLRVVRIDEGNKTWYEVRIPDMDDIFTNPVWGLHFPTKKQAMKKILKLEKEASDHENRKETWL